MIGIPFRLSNASRPTVRRAIPRLPGSHELNSAAPAGNLPSTPDAGANVILFVFHARCRTHERHFGRWNRCRARRNQRASTTPSSLWRHSWFPILGTSARRFSESQTPPPTPPASARRTCLQRHGRGALACWGSRRGFNPDARGPRNPQNPPFESRILK